MTSEEPRGSADYADRPSNPNSAGEHGLTGDMGVSSGRTGPLGDAPGAGGAGIEGTGTKGDAVHRTDGTQDTSPTPWDAVDVSQGDADPNRPAELDETGGVLDEPGVDRTVGEVRPSPVAAERAMHVEDGGPARSV